ncbi:hypothetical protein PR048_006115 [Dryococelus australis]|uniref:Uncharacterized protein n=1 Tax=Dryococelus australis TaxID=614101 RepID=A0ABQ9IA34_9NEOP|nr:hypothetical protein PR048_006115 [Dryococelus australis]
MGNQKPFKRLETLIWEVIACIVQVVELQALPKIRLGNLSKRDRFQQQDLKQIFMLKCESNILIEAFGPWLALKYESNLLLLGAAVAERLACSPPTKAIRVQSPAGSLQIFAYRNRAGQCRGSTGFLREISFPPPFHSGSPPYSTQLPSSAPKTSMLRSVQISSLTPASEDCDLPWLWTRSPRARELLGVIVLSFVPSLLHSHLTLLPPCFHAGRTWQGVCVCVSSRVTVVICSHPIHAKHRLRQKQSATCFIHVSRPTALLLGRRARTHGCSTLRNMKCHCGRGKNGTRRTRGGGIFHARKVRLLDWKARMLRPSQGYSRRRRGRHAWRRHPAAKCLGGQDSARGVEDNANKFNTSISVTFIRCPVWLIVSHTPDHPTFMEIRVSFPNVYIGFSLVENVVDVASECPELELRCIPRQPLKTTDASKALLLRPVNWAGD